MDTNKLLYFVYVFIGSGLGGLLRYCIALWIGPHKFSLATILANASAALLLGIITAAIPSKNIPSDLKYLLAIGFCGGLSTYSTFTLEAYKYLISSQFFIAIAYTLANLLISLSMLWLGLWLAKQ
jgi:CrcB protein